MTSIRALIKLQGLDSELTSRHEQLDNIRQQLEDTEELDTLRTEVAELRQLAHTLEQEQKSADWEVAQIAQQVSTEEAKLYGGSVKNPKELASLDQEVKSLNGRKKQLEETALEALSRVEEQQAKLDKAQAQLDATQAERDALEHTLQAAQSTLEREVSVLDSERKAVAASVPARDLSIYGTLLASKQGRAVTRIERATCQGCRINLPNIIQQRVRTDQTLVQCPSCGRLLYTN